MEQLTAPYFFCGNVTLLDNYFAVINDFTFLL